MKNVLVRLQEYSAQATTTEKEVIAFLLKEPEQAAGCQHTRIGGKDLFLHLHSHTALPEDGISRL